MLPATKKKVVSPLPGGSRSSDSPATTTVVRNLFKSEDEAEEDDEKQKSKPVDEGKKEKQEVSEGKDAHSKALSVSPPQGQNRSFCRGEAEPHDDEYGVDL